MRVRHMDWTDELVRLQGEGEPNGERKALREAEGENVPDLDVSETFDVILGSDILYEVWWLRSPCQHNTPTLVGINVLCLLFHLSRKMVFASACMHGTEKVGYMTDDRAPSAEQMAHADLVASVLKLRLRMAGAAFLSMAVREQACLNHLSGC